MKRFLLFSALMVCIRTGFADNETSFVIDVPKTFYDHPIHLMQPRVDQWHNRGKQAEKAALATFTAQQYKVSSCNTETYGKALILILPSMFYNPQDGVFHSEIIAKIYTLPNLEGSLKKPILEIKGQGESRGWLSPSDENFTYESYRRAFNEVIENLQRNNDFQKVMNETASQDFKTLCKQFEVLTE